ncbi:MAG TPA: aspartate aminotransferase family protein [Anaerolineae bacterium]|nr:aspartate aminotransferase family protein [Anaerolineae bacterium]
MSPIVPLPAKGVPKDTLLGLMREMKARDAPWREGKVFSMVYYVDDELTEVLKAASALFFSENALNPTAFPSIRQMETEVVAMTAALLGGDEETVGTLTSGGTESLLMTVKTARDWGRDQKGITEPEMILPLTAHPAFEKAAHYFGVRPVHIPVGPDFRADLDALERAFTPNTVLVVGSAPSYPQGIMDPIPEMAAMARERDVLFHVDACVGGFMLPFLRELGYPVPPFDFRVPGVTSISADAHKYGYAAKGVSVILYHNADLRRYQFFAYTDWPGGIYASPAMAGTRAAGPIAAAWAVMHFLGWEGYLRLARQTMETAQRLQQAFRELPGLFVYGEPVMTVFAVGSRAPYEVYEIADEMALRGWHLDRQHRPPSLHFTIVPAHARVVDAFLEDLHAAVAQVRRPSPRRAIERGLVRFTAWLMRVLPRKVSHALMRLAPKLFSGSGDKALPQRAAPMYGLIGTLPNRQDVHEAVLDLLDQIFRPPESGKTP